MKNERIATIPMDEYLELTEFVKATKENMVLNRMNGEIWYFKESDAIDALKKEHEKSMNCLRMQARHENSTDTKYYEALMVEKERIFFRTINELKEEIERLKSKKRRWF